MSKDLITLDSLKAKNLPELQGLKDKQNELVKECPFIQIIDNQSYELAKKHRTTLVKGRTSLEAQDKLIASKLSSFRKDVKTLTDELIAITLPHEEKQQNEVKRYEQIKENERLEKERLENERIENIKNKIQQLENDSYIIINGWGVEVLSVGGTIFTAMDTDFDFEEFDILYQQAKQRVQEHCENKIKTLQEKENQRIENERLAREKAESDAKLKAIQEQQEKERLEREENERIEKEKFFDIKVDRLAQIGYFLVNDFFRHDLGAVPYSKESIFEAKTIEFEEILNNCKRSIELKKESLEKQAAEKEAQEKADAEQKEKAEKENKARVKRLSKDKKIYEQTLNDTLGRFPIVFDSDQKEIKEFSIEASNKVTDLLKELLTDLQKL